MKKVVFASAFFLLLLVVGLLIPKVTSAQVSCPSAKMQCGSLDAQGGCVNPCLRVITKGGGGGGRGGAGAAQCQCQIAQNTPGTVPKGGNCQEDEDCVSSAPYCWAGPGQPATCHVVSRGGGGPTIPVYDPGCTKGDTDNVKTALGCLPTDPETFVNTALPWAIGVGAGIAFLLGVFGSMMIVLSAGNPEKMQAGKEMITSAIAGLLLIIFAVLILNVVGVKVLNLFDFPPEPPHPGGGGR